MDFFWGRGSTKFFFKIHHDSVVKDISGFGGPWTQLRFDLFWWYLLNLTSFNCLQCIIFYLKKHLIKVGFVDVQHVPLEFICPIIMSKFWAYQSYSLDHTNKMTQEFHNDDMKKIMFTNGGRILVRYFIRIN